jgi:hypothetical protein
MLSAMLKSWKLALSAFQRRAASTLAKLGPAPSPQGWLRRELERTLNWLLHSSGNAPVGRVHLIDVRAVLERLVDRGGKSEPAIHQAILSCIQRHVVRGDFVAQNDRTTYIVVFRELSPDDADVQCALIAREIGYRLFGEGESVDILVRASNPQKGEVAFEPLPPLEQLLRRHQSKRRQVTAQLPSGSGDKGPQWRNQARERSGLQPAPPDAPSLRASAFAALAAEDDRLDLEFASQGGEESMAELREILPRIAREARRSADGSDDERLLAEANIEVVAGYRPVWNASRAVIGAFAPRFCLRMGNAEMPFSELSEDDIDLVGLADRVTLKRCIADLVGGLERGRRHLVILPVSSSGLAHSLLRQVYLANCATLTDVCRSHIVWEIRAKSSGLLDTQLLPAVATLRPYGRSVIVCGDLPPACFRQMAAMGVHAMGLNLAAATGGEREVIRKLELLAAHASTHRMRAIAHDCHKVSLTAAAICAGLEYLDGDAIAPIVSNPTDPFRFSLDDVYRPLLNAAAAPRLSGNKESSVSVRSLDLTLRSAPAELQRVVPRR